MKNEHILNIIDEKSFEELDDAEKLLIAVHTENCLSCRQSFESARSMSILLKTAVTQNFEPTPFFAKRVLANLPERQISVSSLWAFAKLWKASGALIGVMIAMVLALAAITFISPQEENALTIDNDSDMVILDKKLPAKDLNNEQVFQLIYGKENAGKK